MPETIITPDMLPLLPEGDITNDAQLYFVVEDQQGGPNRTVRMSYPTLEDRIVAAAGTGGVDGVHWVDTVADLAGLAPANNDMVHTLGYNTLGDGGHRSLYYLSASGATVDGVTVFNGPGGVGRYLECDLNGVVTPKQGGCIGDGTTDDWLDMVQVVATGLHVIIRNGVFKLSDTITMSTAGQQMSGDKTGQLKQGTENKAIINVTANKVKIEKVRFVGKGASPDPNNNVLNIAVRAVSVWGLRVIDCEIEEVAFSGIYAQDCKVVMIRGNDIWGSITVSHDSSADITCWGTCKTISIVGNKCRSDADVGILVGALQGDKDIIVANNIITTTNSSGTVITPTQRRRCIGLHYSSDADELNHILCANNLCVGSLNAGIYFNGWGGAVTIHGNMVRNTSIGTVDESLSGSIAIHGSARSIIVSGNDCSDNLSDASGCISIYRASAGATANLGSVLVKGNMIHDSSSYGITVRGTTARVRIEGNNITNCTRDGVLVASDAVLDAEGLEINNNTIQWATATACGIFIDTQGSTNMVKCHHNTIIYTGTKGTTAVNSGIYSQRYNLHAHHNTIKGCDGGIYFYTNLTGRTLVPDIEYNLMEDLDVAFICRGNDAHATMPIGLTNKIDNCGVSQGGDGSYEAARFCSVDRINGLITLRRAAAPANGTWVIGDTYYRTAPAAAGYIGGVCTAAGTPGTWKDFGAIVA